MVEEFLEGEELSLLALCDGETAVPLASAQDYKRIFDGDEGPNTGGMGSYSPVPSVDADRAASMAAAVHQPVLDELGRRGIAFHGVLYAGLMMTADGPRVLEFNVRFGDPETQVYLPRLDNDLVEVLEASRSGKLNGMKLRWQPGASVCVVMASGGYPGSYQKGKVIEGIDAAARLPTTKVFHAGTGTANGKIVTSGGRVLGVTAWGDDLRQAQAAAYRAVDCIHFEGAHFRRDIATRARSPTERVACRRPARHRARSRSNSDLPPPP